MKRLLYILIAMLWVQFACIDPYADGSYIKDVQLLPIASFLEHEPDVNASYWVDLLNYTGTFTTMNLNAAYTCFVPDNDAMQQFLAAKNLNSVVDMNIDDAKLLIRYHTIRGHAYNSIDFNEGLISDSTASGDYLSTSFDEFGGAVKINLEAQINKTYQATNGFIHTINKVLTPVTETIWGMLHEQDFSIMKEAVELTKLDDILDKTYQSNGQGKLNKKTLYTMFIVPDSVFVRNGIQQLDDLIAYLGADTDFESDDNALHQYISYHLINRQISYFDMTNFTQTDKVRSRNVNTMATNQLINISEVDKVLYLNYSDNEGTELIRLNLNCKNGVVHTIDGLLPVMLPKPSKLQWELTDYPELSVIPDYRKAPGTNSYEYLLGPVDCYTVLPVPDSSTGWTYFISSKGDATRTKALHGDFLNLRLGYFGWIEMTSPSILAGKYKVYLEHFNPKGAEKTGKLSFIMDGEYLGSQITTRGESATTDQFLKTLIGEIEFPETSIHTLRILAGDTSSSLVDCITFEPTN